MTHFGDDVVEASDPSSVAKILASAFADDPIMSWIFQDTKRLELGLRAMISRLYVPMGRVTMHESGDGTAAWITSNAQPRVHFSSALSFALSMIRVGALRTLQRGTIVEHHFETFRPKKPHAYLFIVGVYPASQRKGIGTSLITEGMRWAKDQNLPVQLETSKPNLVRFYEGFGFETVAETRPAKGAPLVWIMRTPDVSN